MGFPVETKRVRIRVPAGGPKADDVRRVIEAVDKLYRIISAVELGGHGALVRRRLRPVPEEFALRLIAFHYGSEGSSDWLGIAKALKVVLETIRDWSQKRKQQEYKTAQEEERTRQARQETIAKRIANAKDFVALHDQIKALPREDQKRIRAMIAGELDELDRSSVELLPD
jgi:hypothetical protein